jgi:transposase
MRLPAKTSACVANADDLVPIGVFARAEDAGPALIAGAQQTSTSRSACDGTPSRRPAMDERPGVIEIDLPAGARLRVDAFVNERALRRVLAALKAAT